jgi:mono/diheme cytochrome c family protein
MHHSKAEVVDIIKNGAGRMPALGGDMSNAEAEQIADYVLTLKKP